MVNNYPEYAAGVNYKKTDSNDVTHFYSAQVIADPSDDTIESKLIKDGVVISEGGDFSMATMTLSGAQNRAGGSQGIQVETCVMYYDSPNPFIQGVNNTSVPNGLPYGIYDIPLYKGHAVAFIGTSNNYIVTGDATVDENGVIDITGDFTIAEGA